MLLMMGMRNEGAWVTLGQSLGFMFSQHTHGFSCLTSNAPKGSFEGDLPSLPTRVGSMSNDEGQHVEAPCST